MNLHGTLRGGGNQDKLPVGDLELAIARNLGSIGFVFWKKREEEKEVSFSIPFLRGLFSERQETCKEINRG